MPTPDIDKPTPEFEEQSCYDRDLLREQITMLRKEASQRVKLEEMIEKKCVWKASWGGGATHAASQSTESWIPIKH